MTTDPKSGPTRRAPRVNHEVMVGVTSDAGTFSGWGTNLSTGGVFVNTPTAPERGTLVSVLLQLPGVMDCKLQGRVAWSQLSGPGVDEPGIGIEFTEADDSTRKTISEMLEKLQKDLQKQPV